MKVIFLSDTHFDNYTAFSSIDERGYNTRFLQQLETMERVLQRAEDMKARVIHGGDLFNRRILIPADCLHLVYMLFQKYDKQIIDIVVGNHDAYSSSSEDSPLHVFTSLPHVNILTRRTNIHLDTGVIATLVPFGLPLPKKPKNTDFSILVAHTGVNEASLGPRDYRRDFNLSVTSVKKLKYDLVLLGHIHKAQLVSDVIVMGSLLPHSFHEAEESKYFYIFDTETKKLEKSETGAPKFRVHKVKTKKQLKAIDVNDGDYHKIDIVSAKISHADVLPYTGPNVIVTRGMEQERPVQIEEVEKGRTPQDEIADYFDAIETDLDKERLKEIGVKIVEAGGAA